jgi:hypothetical protein
MTLSALGIFSAAGAGGVAAGTYELIETQILGSSQASVVFSNLGTYSSTYKHLQIRIAGRGTHATSLLAIRLQANGVTTSSYSTHGLFGNGSSVGSYGYSSLTSMYGGILTGSSATANSFGGSVLDILDAYSTTKNKTVRVFYGGATTEVGYHSGAFLSTASITSINLFPDASSFAANSRFSIYGVRG